MNEQSLYSQRKFFVCNLALVRTKNSQDKVGFRHIHDFLQLETEDQNMSEKEKHIWIGWFDFKTDQ